MSIEEKIVATFPNAGEFKEAEGFFLENPNIMELDTSPDLMVYVPAYILWCLDNPGKGTVEDWTLTALAEYGRCKDLNNKYLNFMHLCNDAQKVAVVQFLEYYLSSNLGINEAQIKRAIKNWKF